MTFIVMQQNDLFTSHENVIESLNERIQIEFLDPLDAIDLRWIEHTASHVHEIEYVSIESQRELIIKRESNHR